MTLKRELVQELVARLCALPVPGAGREDDSGEHRRSATWTEMEWALRRSARSAEHASRIVARLEEVGIRPDSAAIARMALSLVETPETSESPDARPGRADCLACGGTKLLVEWRLVWTELTDSGPKKRSRKVDSWAAGCDQAVGLGPECHAADVCSVSVACACALQPSEAK